MEGVLRGSVKMHDDCLSRPSVAVLNTRKRSWGRKSMSHLTLYSPFLRGNQAGT